MLYIVILAYIGKPKQMEALYRHIIGEQPQVAVAYGSELVYPLEYEICQK
jgi:hypothetical protein